MAIKYCDITKWQKPVWWPKYKRSHSYRFFKPVYTFKFRTRGLTTNEKYLPYLKLKYRFEKFKSADLDPDSLLIPRRKRKRVKRILKRTIDNRYPLLPYHKGLNVWVRQPGEFRGFINTKSYIISPLTPGYDIISMRKTIRRARLSKLPHYKPSLNFVKKIYLNKNERLAKKFPPPANSYVHLRDRTGRMSFVKFNKHVVRITAAKNNIFLNLCYNDRHILQRKFVQFVNLTGVPHRRMRAKKYDTRYGKNITLVSAGLAGFKGPKRASFVAFEEAGRKLARIIRKRKIKVVDVILKTANFKVYTPAIRGLMDRRIKINIENFYLQPPIPHSKGLRKKKVRRV